MRTTALAALSAFAALAVACGGEGNTGRLSIDPALVAEVPWINGAPPIVDASGAPTVPVAPVYPQIGPGTPDPGSRVLFDTEENRAKACAPLANIEVSQWHHDFEPVGGGMVGVAQFFSMYDDKSDGSWHVPGDASWYSSIVGLRGTVLGEGALTPAAPWGLAADAIQNGPSCDGTPNNWALHLKGGRFNYYGGGAEHPLDLDCRSGGQAEACSHMVDAVGDGRVDRALDVSDYDGIAFWARRGPDSITGLMLALQDKYTSDRLQRTSELGTPGPGWCRRVKQCIPTCAEGATCEDFTANSLGFRCVPPGGKPQEAALEPALIQQIFPPCGVNTCTPPSYDPDPDFENTQCKPYNFTGLEENYYCFGDTPPPASDQRCGDGFVQNVSLSTDWTYYKLPFDRFQQVGFAKKAPASDNPKRAIYSLAFLFSVGNIDFYIDNLTFYRNR